jgi:hypothetical protein
MDEMESPMQIGVRTPHSPIFPIFRELTACPFKPKKCSSKPPRLVTPEALVK